MGFPLKRPSPEVQKMLNTTTDPDKIAESDVAYKVHDDLLQALADMAWIHQAAAACSENFSDVKRHRYCADFFREQFETNNEEPVTQSS